DPRKHSAGWRPPSTPSSLLQRLLPSTQGSKPNRYSRRGNVDSLADMRFLDRALPSTTQGLLAAAAGVKSSTLAVRVLRAGGRDLGLDGRIGVVIDALGADRSQVTHPQYPEFERHIRAAGGATLIEDTLQWVKPWLAGESLGVLDHRYGRGIEWMRQLARAIERLDHLYRAGVVNRTIPLDEIDQKLLKLGVVKKGRRGPKLRDALVLARGLDQLAKGHPREWQVFLSAARLQRRGLEEVNLAAVQGLNISQYPEGRSRALVVLIALAIDDILRQRAT
ncbi:hypothetical protein, partial [Solimonas sp. SE-A11]|uniref:hypothetical protein n=1 Tax=Solimonas sp. SE-A11 TaxID=3054954 RepID=UPI00259D0145